MPHSMTEEDFGKLSCLFEAENSFCSQFKAKKLQNKWKSVEDTVCSQSALVCCEFIDLILHLEKMFLLSAFIIYVFINCIMRI